MEVLHSSDKMRSTFWHGENRREMRVKASTPTLTPKRRDTVTETMMSLSEVDHVVTRATPSHFEAMLYIFEDNEAVIKMILKAEVRQ